MYDSQLPHEKKLPLFQTHFQAAVGVARQAFAVKSFATNQPMEAHQAAIHLMGAHESTESRVDKIRQAQVRNAMKSRKIPFVDTVVPKSRKDLREHGLPSLTKARSLDDIIRKYGSSDGQVYKWLDPCERYSRVAFDKARKIIAYDNSSRSALKKDEIEKRMWQNIVTPDDVYKAVFKLQSVFDGLKGRDTDVLRYERGENKTALNTRRSIGSYLYTVLLMLFGNYDIGWASFDEVNYASVLFHPADTGLGSISYTLANERVVPFTTKN